jgi:hypothetical protein
MQPIAGAVTTSPAEVANDNVLALNTSMFQLYGDASKVFQRNILAQHPVILGLFSGAGGRFILYRPGAAPLEAPPVPVVYQLLKSVGHSAMALTEVISPYIDNPANQAWRASLLAYRSQCNRRWIRWMPPTCRPSSAPSLTRSSRTMSRSWTPALRRARSRWATYRILRNYKART